jgi:hypothetical protein
MSRCLDERALLSLYAGGGDRSRREHLARCRTCEERYHELAAQCAELGGVLRDGPAPRFETVERTSLLWVPAVAAIALCVVLLVPALRSIERGEQAGEGEPVEVAFEDVSAALFTQDDASTDASSQDQVGPLDYLETALAGDSL